MTEPNVGVFSLVSRGVGSVAASNVKDNMEELKKLIETTRCNTEVVELVEKVNVDKEAWKEVDKKFKKKLAKTVHKLDFNAGGLHD